MTKEGEDLGGLNPLGKDIEQTDQELKSRSSRLMTEMKKSVPENGQFFAEFGFEDTSNLVDDLAAPVGTFEEGFDGRVYLLTDALREGEATIFTAITGAGSRQIKAASKEEADYIRKQISDNLDNLVRAQTEYRAGLSEEERKRSIKDRGVGLNEGLLDKEGTTIQLGNATFSVGHNLIDDPSQESVVGAMTRSIEISKKKATLTRERLEKQQRNLATVEKLSAILNLQQETPSS